MRHPARDTQLEHIRELGCEIMDQIKPVFDPTFALHPLVLTNTHIAALRADAGYEATDLDGTRFGWIAVAGRLGELHTWGSKDWDGWRHPRKWRTKLWAHSHHLHHLVGNYAAAEFSNWDRDRTQVVPLRIRFEELHRLGVALVERMPLSFSDLVSYVNEHSYYDGLTESVNVKGFLRDPFYAWYNRARHQDVEQDQWWLWDRFSRVVLMAANDSARSLTPEAQAIVVDLEEVQDASTAPSDDLTDEEWEVEIAHSRAGAAPSYASIDHPGYEEVLQGEPMKDVTARLAGEWRIFEAEDKLLLRAWAKEVKKPQSELKLQLMASGIVAAVENCMEPQHVKFGRNAREGGGEKIKPWLIFRDDPTKFAHWFKTYALSHSTEELRREGNARIEAKDRRLLEREERARLGVGGRRRPQSHDSVLGKRDQHDPSLGKHRKALSGAAEMLSDSDEYLGDASQMDEYEFAGYDHSRRGKEYGTEQKDPFAVFMEEAGLAEREFFVAAKKAIEEAGRELSYDELAELTDKTPVAVRQIFSRARQRHADAIAKVRRPKPGQFVSAFRPPTHAAPPKANAPPPLPDCKTCRKVLKKNAGARILLCPECGRKDESGSTPNRAA